MSTTEILIVCFFSCVALIVCTAIIENMFSNYLRYKIGKGKDKKP